MLAEKVDTRRAMPYKIPLTKNDHSKRKSLYNFQQIDDCKDDHVVILLKTPGCSQSPKSTLIKFICISQPTKRKPTPQIYT